MSETAVLQAAERTEAGKGYSKRLRGSGRIPAVVYGPEIQPANCSIDQRDFHSIVSEHGRNAIITLQIAGSQNGSHSTIIKEVQHNPLSGQVLHVDFHRISLTERIVVEVPVISEGTPLGVRNDGGILEQLLHEIEVECLPTEIPDAVSFDVSDLVIGDSVHISDLSPPPGNAEFVTDGDRSVFVLVPPTVRQVDEEEEEELVEEEEEMQEPEVIERGKRDDEEEEDE